MRRGWGTYVDSAEVDGDVAGDESGAGEEGQGSMDRFGMHLGSWRI